ncbi:hypothetical protein F5Y18DRAFT_402350 [Xylariaceae sp. FL1019]|nr:hypothetical protein F5Y18DRAFT_402350 [Xylariaceae sp. FL1019]
MFAARDQENLAFSHQHGAAIKQQQNQAKTPGARYPKTPIKVPLNDENGAHAIGGAKNILTRGNENAMTSRKGKGVDKSNFVTPMARGARPALGNKTTNAKAKGLQSVNAKSAARELEQSQAKLQTTVKPKQKQPSAETSKLQVHAEEDASPLDDEEVEYCPPKPKDLPYESDVFPDGALNFDVLKPENMFKGYYQFYINPVDENGVSLMDRELEEKTRKALEQGEKRCQEEINSINWGLEDELSPEKPPVVKKIPAPTKYLPGKTMGTVRKPLSSIRSKTAANAMSMDDTTKSLQRRAARTEVTKPLHKKSASFAIPTFSSGSKAVPSSIPKRSPAQLDANSRTTIGYNKGRAAASLLHKRSVSVATTRPPSTTRPFSRAATTASSKTSTSTSSSNPVSRSRTTTPRPRSGTELSNDSNETITPARLHKRSQSEAEDEDREWRERVPFLSIFNPEDCLADSDEEEEDDDPLGIKSRKLDFLDEEEEFQMAMPE